MLHITQNQKSIFRILKGGKVSLVVSGLILGGSPTLSHAEISGINGLYDINGINDAIAIDDDANTSVAITLDGTISTSSDDTGLSISDVSPRSLDINISNASTIEVVHNGLEAYGIKKEASDNDMLNISIVNEGNISIFGEPGSAKGIAINTDFNFNADDINITNSGTITIGNKDTVANPNYAHGITIHSGGIISNLQLSNSGTIETNSDSGWSSGIASWRYQSNPNSHGNQIHNSSITNSDTIYTHSSGTSGISSGLYFASYFSNSFIENKQTGNINTISEASYASDIFVWGLENSTIMNEGNLSANGINFVAGIYSYKNITNSLIHNTGTISVDVNSSMTDYGSYAIFTHNGDGTLFIENNGTILSTVDKNLNNQAYSLFIQDASILNNGTLNGNLKVSTLNSNIAQLTNSGMILLPYNAHTNNAAYIKDFINTKDGTLTISLFSGIDGNVTGNYSQLKTKSSIFENDSTIHVNIETDKSNQSLLIGKTLYNVVMTDNNLTISNSGANIKVSDNSDLLDFQIDPALTDGNIDLRVIQNPDDPAPYAHLATRDSSMLMMNTFQNIVELRQRQINHQKGLNAGDYSMRATSQVVPIEILDQAFWIKPYYTNGSQNTQDNIPGFNVSTMGIGMGYDNEIEENSRLGIGIFYTEADLKMKSQLEENVNMKNYTVLLYGSSLLNDSQTNFMYQLGYAIQQNNSKRTLNTDEYGLQQVHGDYESHILALDLKLMRQYNLSETLTINPLIETTLRKYTTPAYTENGQTDLRLTLHESTNYQTIFSVGNMLEYNLEEDSRWIVDTRVGYDFKHDKNGVSASYTSDLAPQEFIHVKDIDNNGFIYKLGISYEINHEEMLFDLGYNLEGEGSGYKNHIFSAKLVYKL